MPILPFDSYKGFIQGIEEEKDIHENEQLANARKKNYLDPYDYVRPPRPIETTAGKILGDYLFDNNDPRHEIIHHALHNTEHNEHISELERYKNTSDRELQDESRKGHTLKDGSSVYTYKLFYHGEPHGSRIAVTFPRVHTNNYSLPHMFNTYMEPNEGEDLFNKIKEHDEHETHNYSRYYIKAIQYNKETDHFSDIEGHQIHDNGGPLIYADWLEEKGFEHLPKFVREAKHHISSAYHSNPVFRFYRDGGYDNLPTQITVALRIPSKQSKLTHHYIMENLPKDQAKQVADNLQSEGVKWIPS